MKELTKTGEHILQDLWRLEKAFVKDIIGQLPNPKPAYTTVSTIIRTPGRKGFIDHYYQEKTYKYFPVNCKTDYTKLCFRNFMGGYFNNPFQEMVSFKENKMPLSDLEVIIKEVGKDWYPNNPRSNNSIIIYQVESGISLKLFTLNYFQILQKGLPPRKLAKMENGHPEPGENLLIGVTNTLILEESN